MEAWWAGPHGDLARRTFLGRAADYFGRQRVERDGGGKLLAVEQLAPHFREIRLRLDLGTEDQVRAALECMADLDSLHLRRWGLQHVLGPWRRELVDREVGTHYWRGNLSALAAGALELDQTDEALVHLERALASVPSRPVGGNEDARAREDRLDLLNQAAGAYWRDGRLSDARRLYEEQLHLTGSAPGQPTARALLGLAACAAERGDVNTSAHRLQDAEALSRHLGDRKGRNLHALVLLGRAELARLGGNDGAAIDLAVDAAVRASGNVEIEVRALDLEAGVRLEQGRSSDAVDLAERASAAAIRTGASDITRSAHATLALAYLALERAEDALSAASAAVRFFPSRRALIGTVVLGLAHVRMVTRGGAAYQAFSEVVRQVDSYPPEDRPYWVWDTLALAEAGRYVCGDTAAEGRSAEAYHRARALSALPGTRRRCLLFLDLLGMSKGPDLIALRAVADHTPQWGAEVGPRPTRLR